jgi:cell wall-associated NlpC family hydrolase
MLSAGVALLAAAGTLTGVLIVVVSAAPSGQLGSAEAAGAAGRPAASSLLGLPTVRPSTGSASAAPGLAMGANVRLLAVPTAFDCSGLVQWSFAQAGLVMPRVAADQALTGPAVPVSQLQPGDLLFYHTDPTAPSNISRVAIYLGNGWMLQAPEPGLDVEAVPADFGTEFAGAVRVSPAQAAAVAGRLA